MSSKKSDAAAERSRLFSLLSMYNSFIWDIVRAYMGAEISNRELLEYLVEHDVAIQAKTISEYASLYRRIKDMGYSDNTIDKKTPKQWRNWFLKLNKQGVNNGKPNTNNNG